MRVSFQLEGATQLEANLKTLGRRVQKKVVRQAVRAGQKILLARAKANARALGHGQSHPGRDMSELLARNTVIAAPRKQNPGSYSLHVQMRKGVAEFVHKSEAGRETYIPAAIEYGHMAGSTYVVARPFLRPVADASTRERIDALSRKLAAGILREAIQGRYG